MGWPIVAAPFPSIDQHHSAEIVRREVMLSNIDVSGTDWKEMARYLRMTSPPRLWGKWRVRKFLPRRSKVGGTEPSITGPEASSGHKTTNQWEYPTLTPSKHDKKLLLAACLAVGVRECFRSHTYMFAGDLFRQLV